MNRKSALAKVHIGKKALGWRDDDYRAVLQGRYGAESAALLADRDLADLCEYMQRQGVKFRRRAVGKTRQAPSPRSFYPIPEGTPYERQKRWICALWAKLGYDPAGLDTRVDQQFRVAKLVWLHDQNALQILAKDLYTRCRKRGLDPEPW